MMEVRLRYIAALLATAEALQLAAPVGGKVTIRRCAPPFAIAAGSALPAVDIELMVTENLVAAAGVSAAELDGGASSISLPLAEAVGKAPTLLVGMPGTRTCTELQLPRLIEKVKQLSAEGVESVGVLTSKDRYNDATWKRAVKKVASSKTAVAFLADGGTKAAKALGLADGTRYKRFALVIDNGVVAHVATDDDGAELSNTDAAAIINVLRGPPKLLGAKTRTARAKAPSATSDSGDLSELIGPALALFVFLYLFSPI